MSAGNHHQIWIEQCEAARTIRERFGLQAAFDYAVGEKLMNFASAASEHPAFARELPRFVSEVRRMFSADEIRSHLARLEREQIERDAENRETDEDEFQYESPARAAERIRQFATIKDLLTTETRHVLSGRRVSQPESLSTPNPAGDSPGPRSGSAGRACSQTRGPRIISVWKEKGSNRRLIRRESADDAE